ncbi:hypothetical protein H4R33_003288 [Dimargaris cristalligena]|uniref:VPS4-associated protein 1 n=1 Tax=Dimargaris cristalligena TaxID=215637 RepID=A0A4P9ZSW0_9FUNG|nr:hypothetical protein H4R33_003288 [Dimargaris cristalligena]RKP36666.1 hypothetical protein BJ085DRAFT_31914 [Dimargaris cristalligena]|eukprot:RKP36666.1 hypothetical protein BJ085DRAFT_31914 [Dimargaris cristalligena]
MSPAPFPNVYVLRTAAKEGSCFICSKITPSLLLTAETGLAATPAAKDWFYCCPAHAKDPTALTCLNPPAPPKPAVVEPPPAKRNTTKKTTKAKKGDEGEASDKAASPEKTDSSGSNPAPVEEKPTLPSAPSEPQGPLKYALHRSLYYLRESQYQDKINHQKALEMAKRFPSVPRSLPKPR